MLSLLSVRRRGPLFRVAAVPGLVWLLCMPMAGAMPAVQVQNLVDRYLVAWTGFYPTGAFARGNAGSALRFEDYGDERLSQWLRVNRELAAEAQDLAATALPGDAAVDLRVLRRQLAEEVAAWREDQPLQRQAGWYAGQVSQALTHVLVREQLTTDERVAALRARLLGVQRLCATGVQSLRGGGRERTRLALSSLAASEGFYRDGLPGIVRGWVTEDAFAGIAAELERTAESIATFRRHIEDEVMPATVADSGIGADVYAAKLSRQSDGLETPASLGEAARQEVRTVRGLMVEEAHRWWRAGHDSEAPTDEDHLVNLALEAMEKDRQDSAGAFLREFRDLTAAAEGFVKANGIATVPQPTTLRTELSPAHFAGAAVGGVYPPGPFAPDADTLFYVPSIPDSAADDARTGFYRSFNTHFNTMILSHEMFPGHYLQYKVAVMHAPAVRTLFSDGAYVEGWGTFSEELMLDAGWAGNAPLTRLAHLRKRLENATRAYVSVMVNTQGWGESEVRDFAVTEGLLAPQFATNLWHRVVNTPMQIPDYFRGYRRFVDLWQEHRQRGALSDREWVDAVLRAGPVAMTDLPGILQRKRIGAAE